MWILNLEHHLTIYERFVICFITLNGPLSRLTTQYILTNIRPRGYYKGKYLLFYIVAVNCQVQASAMLIFLFLNINNLSHFRQNYSKTIFEYEFFGQYSKIFKNNFLI